MKEEFNPYGEGEDDVFSVREHKKKIKKTQLQVLEETKATDNSENLIPTEEKGEEDGSSKN